MADKAPAFAFTMNIPVQCHIRFVDVRPGKPWDDPKKGRIQLPAQVSLKGSFDGVDTIAFLKGKVWANVKALVSAGVISDEWAAQTDDLEATTEVVSLPVLNGTVTATYAKGPKDQYANMVFTKVGGTAPAQPKRLPEGTKSQPFDLPTRAEAMDAAMSEVEGDYPESWDEPQPLPVFSPAPTADKLMALATRYAGLFKVMDGKLKDAYGTKIPPETVQAATVSVWISAKDKGLV